LKKLQYYCTSLIKSMKIIVDAGNSYIKVFFLSSQTVTKKIQFSYAEIALFVLEMQTHAHLPIIISDVSGRIDTSILSQLPSHYFLFSHSHAVPITIEYQTISTLGLDRIANAVGSVTLRPNTNKLIIDIGTAITIDFVDANNTFKGGVISPGMHTRFDALHSKTGNLPLVAKDEKIYLHANTTESAIQSGVIQGIVFEIRKYIETYNTIYPDIKVFLCGGDAFFFEKFLKKRIFAEPNLLAIGLQTIYAYNVTN